MIAGPGDWVSVANDGAVSVNGETLQEPYVYSLSIGASTIDYPYQVPDGCIFVMGDHRSVSTDSRNDAIGCVAYEDVIGWVFIRLTPIFERHFSL